MTWRRPVTAVLAPHSLPPKLRPYKVSWGLVSGSEGVPFLQGRLAPLLQLPGVWARPRARANPRTTPRTVPPSGAQALGSPRCPCGAPGAPQLLELSIPAGRKRTPPPVPGCCRAQSTSRPRAPQRRWRPLYWPILPSN